MNVQLIVTTRVQLSVTVVVVYGATTPHRECSDVELRQIIETHHGTKQLRWRWMPSYRVIKWYHTDKEKKDTICCCEAV